MAEVRYINGDSNHAILKKILRKLAEEFDVSAENLYRQNDGINHMLKKLLRIFNEDATFGSVGDVSGISGVYSNAGDPNGVVTATAIPAICLDTTNNVIWWKTVGEGTNTNWV